MFWFCILFHLLKSLRCCSCIDRDGIKFPLFRFFWLWLAVQNLSTKSCFGDFFSSPFSGWIRFLAKAHACASDTFCSVQCLANFFSTSSSVVVLSSMSLFVIFWHLMVVLLLRYLRMIDLKHLPMLLVLSLQVVACLGLLQCA